MTGQQRTSGPPPSPPRSSGALVERNSSRATRRMSRAAKGTMNGLLVAVGRACKTCREGLPGTHCGATSAGPQRPGGADRRSDA